MSLPQVERRAPRWQFHRTVHIVQRHTDVVELEDQVSFRRHADVKTGDGQRAHQRAAVRDEIDARFVLVRGDPPRERRAQRRLDLGGRTGGG